LEGHQWFYHSPEGQLFCQPERSSSCVVAKQSFSLPAFFSTEGGDKRQQFGEFTIPPGAVFQGLEIDALEWADQGSGEQKGLMFASLIGADGSQVGQEMRLFGPAPHSMTTFSGHFGLEAFDVHPESAETIGKVVFTFRVGGGGGARHSLTVKAFNGSLVMASPAPAPARLYLCVDEKHALTLSPSPSTTFSCLRLTSPRGHCPFMPHHAHHPHFRFSPDGQHPHFRHPHFRRCGSSNEERLRDVGSFLAVHLKEMGLPVDVSLEECDCKKKSQCDSIPETASSCPLPATASSSSPPSTSPTVEASASRIPRLLGNLFLSVLDKHTDQCNELAQAIMGPDAVAIKKLEDGRVSIIVNPRQ